MMIGFMNKVRPDKSRRPMLRSLFKQRPPRSATFITSEFGNYYAKVPFIVASLKGDTCPLLRTILTNDLGCGKITEISGEGGWWWDFTYGGTRFTCELLVAACRGSEFYPRSCTASTAAERDLLQKLIQEIIHYANTRASAD
jgi:hypothetical protein